MSKKLINDKKDRQYKYQTKKIPKRTLDWNQINMWLSNICKLNRRASGLSAAKGYLI